MRVVNSALVLAMALGLVLSGCLDDTHELEQGPSREKPAPWLKTHEFEGGFLHSGQDPLSYSFIVPNGTHEIEGLLTWDTPGAQLGFTFYGPDGEQAAAGWNERDGRAFVTTTHLPPAGEWKAEVEIESGFQVDFMLGITLRESPEKERSIQATFEVAQRNPAREVPDELAEGRSLLYGLGQRDYAEINLNMVPGDGFVFSWQADQEVYFNVHFHGEDGTERPIEDRTSTMERNFTADLTEIYALLWRNENNEPVTVTVQMEGTFRLHSMTRDR